jgi:hypothetical protein
MIFHKPTLPLAQDARLKFWQRKGCLARAAFFITMAFAHLSNGNALLFEYETFEWR